MNLLKRRLNGYEFLLFSLLPLLSGLLFYFIFRGRLGYFVFPTSNLLGLEMASPFYGSLPSFLHALSFSLIFMIFDRSGSGFFRSLFCCLGWECLQFFVPQLGTFDVNDIAFLSVGLILGLILLQFRSQFQMRLSSEVLQGDRYKYLRFVSIVGCVLTSVATSAGNRTVSPKVDKAISGPLKTVCPTYIAYSDLRKDVLMEKPRRFVGRLLKVMKSGRFSVVLEQNIGLHFFEVDSQLRLVPVGFFPFQGVTNLISTDRGLYFDNFVDIVLFDVSNAVPRFKERFSNIIAWNPYHAFMGHDILLNQNELDSFKGVVGDYANCSDNSTMPQSNSQEPNELTLPRGISFAQDSDFLFVSQLEDLIQFDLQAGGQLVKRNSVVVPGGVGYLSKESGWLFAMSSKYLSTISIKDFSNNLSYRKMEWTLPNASSVGRIGKFLFAATCSDGYVCLQNSDKIDSFDVTDPESPKYRKSFGIVAKGSIASAQDTLYACTSLGLESFKYSESSGLERLGTIADEECLSISIDGDILSFTNKTSVRRLNLLGGGKVNDLGAYSGL